jgi:hypothetical protein
VVVVMMMMMGVVVMVVVMMMMMMMMMMMVVMTMMMMAHTPPPLPPYAGERPRSPRPPTGLSSPSSCGSPSKRPGAATATQDAKSGFATI